MAGSCVRTENETAGLPLRYPGNNKAGLRCSVVAPIQSRAVGK